MSAPANGDIVLVSFPFTNLKGQKLRPAVVISQAAVLKNTDDCTLVFISSVVPTEPEPYEIVFKVGHPDFKKSGLKKDSVFKAHKVATVEKRLIKRQLGALGETIRKELHLAFYKANKI